MSVGGWDENYWFRSQLHSILSTGVVMVPVLATYENLESTDLGTKVGNY